MTLVSGKAQRAPAMFWNSTGASVLHSELGQQRLQDASGGGGGGESAVLRSAGSSQGLVSILLKLLICLKREISLEEI